MYLLYMYNEDAAERIEIFVYPTLSSNNILQAGNPFSIEIMSLNSKLGYYYNTRTAGFGQ